MILMKWKCFLKDPTSDEVTLPITLLADETKDTTLPFTTDDVTIPHKLRGSFSYILVSIIILIFIES